MTGKVICRDAQDMLAPGEYHLAVDAWFINDKNQILIQKRSLSKKAYPGLWAQSAGGAVLKGEDSFQAFIREVEEELGIIPDIGKTELVHSFIRHGNTIADVYLIHQSISLDKLTLQKSEKKILNNRDKRAAQCQQICPQCYGRALCHIRA